MTIESNFSLFSFISTQLVTFLFLFHRLLCDEVNYDPALNLEYRGPVAMKGKPDPMNVWILTRNTLNKESLKKSSSMTSKQRVTPI